MQTISDDLLRILSGRFGAGADGFRSRVTLPDTDYLGPASTATAWTGSAAYGCAVATAGMGYDLGAPADVVDGNPGTALGFADGVVGGGTTNEDVQITLPVRTVIYSVTVLDVDPAMGARTRVVLVDGVPVAGAFTDSDAGGWVTSGLPIGYSLGNFHTWRPTVPLIGTIITVRVTGTFGGYTYWGRIAWNEVLIRGGVVSPMPLNGITRISIDKTLQTDSDAFDVECDLGDNDFASWLPYAVPDARVIIEQWFGDEANAIQTFEGFLDKPDESRDPRTITLTGKCWMKHALMAPAIITAPQGATETGAVRTAANGVYLNMEVSAIVADIVSRMNFPSSTIAPTSYLVAELIVPDNEKRAATLSGLALLVGYRSDCDEHGSYHFEPPTADPTPVAIFRAGGPCLAYPTALDIVSLDRASDDYELATRVKVVGPMATSDLNDSWTETWSTPNVPAPTGIAYDPADPGNMLVVSGSTGRIYTVRQSDRVILSVSAPITGCHAPAGLSVDPSDSSVLWLLDRLAFGSTTCTIKKLVKATLAVTSSWSLPSGLWVDIKADGSYLWLANLTTGQFHTRSKADGSALAAFTIGGRSDPTGVAVDGVHLYFFFAGSGQALQYDAPDLTTLVRSISTAGTGIIGGEVDTTTHTDLLACSDTAGAGPGTVWKYAIKVETAGSRTISVVVISGVDGAVDPEPTIPTGPLETALEAAHASSPIRREKLQLAAITSYAQATATAHSTLDQLDQFRDVEDFGIVGHPGIQKGDVVLRVDDVTGAPRLLVVDTYRTEMAAGYFGTVAGVPFAP
jgi:hypothetical protein